jgi:hypothetical protein
MMFESASAQSIPNPSVPEFTLKYVDNSHNVLPIYGVDPYTGKNVVTQDGYFIQNKSVEIRIKNQPFTSYRNENNSIVGLWYNVVSKGHFQVWGYGNPGVDNYLFSSDSDYTLITCGLDGNNGSDPFRGNFWMGGAGIIPEGGQLDFRIQALIGYKTKIIDPPVPPFMEAYHYIFTGQSSDWSNTQTISIPDGAVSTATPSPTSSNPTTVPTSTPTSTVPEFPSWTSPLLLSLMLTTFGLLVYYKRQWKLVQHE